LALIWIGYRKVMMAIRKRTAVRTEMHARTDPVVDRSLAPGLEQSRVLNPLSTAWQAQQEVALFPLEVQTQTMSNCMDRTPGAGATMGSYLEQLARYSSVPLIRLFLEVQTMHEHFDRTQGERATVGSYLDTCNLAGGPSTGTDPANAQKEAAAAYQPWSQDDPIPRATEFLTNPPPHAPVEPATMQSMMGSDLGGMNATPSSDSMDQQFGTPNPMQSRSDESPMTGSYLDTGSMRGTPPFGIMDTQQAASSEPAATGFWVVHRSICR
jgi:hypothetical protein